MAANGAIDSATENLLDSKKSAGQRTTTTVKPVKLDFDTTAASPHLTKKGEPDMRFRENKAGPPPPPTPPPPPSQAASHPTLAAAYSVHLTKRGEPDVREAAAAAEVREREATAAEQRRQREAQAAQERRAAEAQRQREAAAAEAVDEAASGRAPISGRKYSSK